MSTPPHAHKSRWNPRSLGLIGIAWFILQFGGIFSPGLLDDVDSIYIEIAREMLQRHDYVTPYVDGIRFFDKPPLMYWMAAGSMKLFGETDWAARLPLALGVLGLLLAVYGLGLRLFAEVSPAAYPDRGAFYAALATATAIGPYLYTRFYIPDILLALWMTLGVHLFLIALDQVRLGKNAAWSSVGFAGVLALSLLTKGLIGLVFPVAFVLLYLLVTKQLRLLRGLALVRGGLVFFAVALPWHVLAAFRNPSIAMPAGVGLPARAGWAWFYLYNEHFARFLGKRIPHDYGQTPVWLFWLYAAIWVMPWATFLPGGFLAARVRRAAATMHQREAAMVLVLWALIVMVFFTLSSRQEYYSIPALPALFLVSGGLLAQAEASDANSVKSALQWHKWLLTPVAVTLAVVCGWFAVTAPHPAPGVDLSTLLAHNPDLYTVSLGHLFDLTGAAMGLFRGPLAVVACGMLALGPAAYVLRKRNESYAANLTIAGGMIAVLLAAHEGLARFNPMLGSKELAGKIAQLAESSPDQITILDGEFTSGSTVVFYTRRPIHLVGGRVNGLWFGSFWPDAPAVFEDEASLRRLWSGPRRINLFTYDATRRQQELTPFGSVFFAGSAGGKTILSNQPI